MIYPTSEAMGPVSDVLPTIVTIVVYNNLCVNCRVERYPTHFSVATDSLFMSRLMARFSWCVTFDRQIPVLWMTTLYMFDT